MSIAIVEDEPKLAALLRDYLHKENFETEVYEDGDEALAALTASPPELILLDLMLPGTDGLSICKELRKTSQVPIIMLTAKVEEIDRLIGLEIGADDYICKPYSPREVVARVKAVLRRSSDNKNDLRSDVAEQAANQFVLEEDAATVRINGQEGTLTAVELQLLKAMHDKPGRIFNREQLMNRIYQDNRVVSDRTIDSHVKKLRQKLEALDPNNEYIHSVYGIGYKYEPAKLP